MERLVIHSSRQKGSSKGIIEIGGDKETTPSHQSSGPLAPGRRNLSLWKPAAKSQFCEGVNVIFASKNGDSGAQSRCLLYPHCGSNNAKITKVTPTTLLRPGMETSPRHCQFILTRWICSSKLAYQEAASALGQN
jgi:hypothetical protein